MKLSICIPTYNRAELLLENLSVIVSQLDVSLRSDVEIVLTDNASNDRTVEMIRTFIAAHPNHMVRLFLNDKNLGLDRNVARVIAEAEGEFCWLLGDDDFPTPGAIPFLMNRLRAAPDCSYFLLNYSRYDKILDKTTSQSMAALDHDLLFANADQFFFTPLPRGSYFRLLGANMLTMSANVFRKSLWQNAIETLKPSFDTNMTHIYVISTFIRDLKEINFIALPMFRYLCNNFRDWGNDIWKDYRTIYYQHLRRQGYSEILLRAAESSQLTYVPFFELVKLIGRKNFLKRPLNTLVQIYAEYRVR